MRYQFPQTANSTVPVKHVPAVDCGKLYPHPYWLRRTHRMLLMLVGARREVVTTVLNAVEQKPGIIQKRLVRMVRYREQNQISGIMTELEYYGYVRSKKA